MAGATVHFNCPRCGLSITPRSSWLTIEHCPRCLARERVAVQMFASRLPASELYSEREAPGPGESEAPPGKFSRAE